MIIKKFKLEGIKVQSFVTSLDSRKKREVKAGAPGTHNGCTMVDNCGTGDNCTELCTFCPCTFDTCPGICPPEIM